MTTIITAALVLLPWNEPTPDVALTGKATFYSAGTMAEVAVNRRLITDTSEYQTWLTANGYVGAVALNRAGDRFREVWLQRPDGTVEGPFFSVDCAQRRHYEAREADNRIVEVDHATAIRWGMNAPLDGVTVWFENPTKRPIRQWRIV